MKRALVALILIVLILPVLYIGISRGAPPRARDYRYSGTTESTPDAGIVLALLGPLMTSETLSALQSRIGETTQLPQGEQTPLAEYLDALDRLAHNMDQIKSRLDDARSSLSSGNRARAITDLQQLKLLRSQTRSLLNSLPRLLERVADWYEIDTSSQSQNLQNLAALFKSYSYKIDQLNASLVRQQTLSATVLRINSSTGEIFVGDVFFLYGELSTLNGTLLTHRNVTITLRVNETLSITTGSQGTFNVTIALPVGFPEGETLVEAAYDPMGVDTTLYLPASATVVISVAYRPSTITLSMFPSNPRPLDTIILRGNLQDPIEGTLLTNRTIVVKLDESTLGNSTTNEIGAFSFNYTLPDSIANGTHRFDVRFLGDKYAMSNATISFDVTLLKPTIIFTADHTTLFSGMRLNVMGNVSYLNSTATVEGNVTVFVDNLLFTNANVDVNGTFHDTIQLPLSLSFGEHQIRVEFVSSRPGVQFALATVQVYVYNTPIITAFIVGVSTATSASIYLVRRRRHAAAMMPTTAMSEPVATGVAVAERPSIEELVRAVKSEEDHAARVRRCYRLAKSLIDIKLGETSRPSETHLEYLVRVSQTAPYVKDELAELVGLFEMADYTPYPLGPEASGKALELLLKIREVTS